LNLASASRRYPHSDVSADDASHDEPSADPAPFLFKKKIKLLALKKLVAGSYFRPRLPSKKLIGPKLKGSGLIQTLLGGSNWLGSGWKDTLLGGNGGDIEGGSGGLLNSRLFEILIGSGGGSEGSSVIEEENGNGGFNGGALSNLNRIRTQLAITLANRARGRRVPILDRPEKDRSERIINLRNNDEVQ